MKSRHDYTMAAHDFIRDQGMENLPETAAKDALDILVEREGAGLLLLELVNSFHSVDALAVDALATWLEERDRDAAESRAEFRRAV